MTHLPETDIIEQAAVHNGWNGLVPGVRALWTTPLDDEPGAPARRIIHARVLQLSSPAKLERVGFRRTQGYVKCGSRPQIDRVVDVRLLVRRENKWHVAMRKCGLPSPGDDILWFDLDDILTDGAIIEVRRCEIDGWWTSWNLARDGVRIEGEPVTQPAASRETRLQIRGVDLSGTPDGVLASKHPGEVRYRTRWYEVGFALGRAGLSWLAIDENETGTTSRNLLRLDPAVHLQGPRFRAIGTTPSIAPLLCNDVTGEVTVSGHTIAYSISLNGTDQYYAIEWTALADRLAFAITRRSSHTMRAWESSAWTIACHSAVTPTAVLGRLQRRGETGAVLPPAIFHAPGHGSCLIEMEGDGALRADSHRPLMLTFLELKTGESAEPEGDHLLPAGEYHCSGSFRPYRTPINLHEDTPPVIRRAVQTRIVTGLTYRPDTATLSNNGNSMHAPLCMDMWSEVARAAGEILPGFSATAMLADSLERWLNGAPGYASGGFAGDKGIHPAEEEYIMTGTAGLLGLADCLAHGHESGWAETLLPQIRGQIAAMKARDVDGDGIVECIHRDGIAGGHQWSTNWYDVISFGWKDAFANALLYRALILLSDALPRLGAREVAGELHEWAERLQKNYASAFFNEKTGWLAGWRDRSGVLHDYAFLPVNGAAACSGVIGTSLVSSSIRALWKEARRVGMPTGGLGLPCNLWHIPDEDLIPLMHGKPLGYYINGGLTHSQARHFVGAMFLAGLDAEATTLLTELCASLADGSAFGGCGSGVDWRYWDGGPSGYEGLLTDQFGILALAVQRYHA